MCWTGYRDCKQIAKKDIPCKKIIAYNKVFRTYTSWFTRNIDYSIGKTYSETIMVYNRTGASWCRDIVDIREGLHCFDDRLESKEKWVDVFRHIIIGSYSFESTQFATVMPVLVDCIIPKGATYYVNVRGEIVTNQLKLVKIHEFNKETDSDTGKET